MIYIDTFTARLLDVYTDLVKKGVVQKKKEMYETIEMKNNTFNFLERRMRNYPEDEERRKRVRVALFEKFGANPEFLMGKSKQMYLREPKPLEKTPAKKAVELNFRDIKEKQKVLDELQSYKDKTKELEDKLAILEEEIKAYKITQKKNPNTDTRPDKT